MRELLADGEEYWEFWLADRFRCTVRELRERLGSNHEFVSWIAWHKLRSQRETLAELKAARKRG